MVKKPEHLRDLAQAEALLCIIDPFLIDSRCGGFDIAPQKLAEEVNSFLQVMA